ncbi:MAG: hypothetical protein NDI69_06560 [Bacteriovoracaceae bacterium]|nr:hypothetical protein [Bacteriovoracaceae bacterium]
MSNKEKALNRMAKRTTTKGSESNLKEQYDIIRNDLLKLREDLSKGYDMAKSMVDRKTLVKQILSTKK